MDINFLPFPSNTPTFNNIIIQDILHTTSTHISILLILINHITIIWMTRAKGNERERERREREEERERKREREREFRRVKSDGSSNKRIQQEPAIACNDDNVY